MDKRDFVQAKKLIMKANSRSKGTYRHILYKLGQLHLEMNEYPSAVDTFEKIMKLDANYEDVRTLLNRAKKRTRK